MAPLVGGWLLVTTTWRWIFYLNLPVGAVALALAWRVLPRTTGQRSGRLDAVGLALLTPGLSALIFGLVQTATTGRFSTPSALWPVLGGAASSRCSSGTPWSPTTR